MSRTIIIKTIPDRLTADAFALACDYMHRGLDRREAWNEFIKDRALRPELDAKAFMSLFDGAGNIPLFTLEEVDFTPTHTDLLKDGMECQIVEDVEDGLFHIWWADGGHGSNPPIYPPEPERFIPLVERNSEMLYRYYCLLKPPSTRTNLPDRRVIFKKDFEDGRQVDGTDELAYGWVAYAKPIANEILVTSWLVPMGKDELGKYQEHLEWLRSIGRKILGTE